MIETLGDDRAYPLKGCANGLTKREYFTAWALTAAVEQQRNSPLSADIIADWAVELADAVIKRLNEEK